VAEGCKHLGGDTALRTSCVGNGSLSPLTKVENVMDLELAKALMQARQDRHTSIRGAAAEIGCSFSVLARFERCGKIGPHVKRKVQLWVYPALPNYSCECFQCNRGSNSSFLDKLWPEIKIRTQQLIRTEFANLASEKPTKDLSDIANLCE
jgi:hypothetical protein